MDVLLLVVPIYRVVMDTVAALLLFVYSYFTNDLLDLAGSLKSFLK